MIRKFLRALLVGAGEHVLAVALVGASSAVLLGALILLFPRGTGLVDFYGDLVRRDKKPGGVARGVDLGEDELGDEIVAVLTRTTRRVKERPADAFEWTAAKAGLPIRSRHAIQTLARSAAAVTLQDRSILNLGENTLAVFAGAEGKRGSHSRRASLVLLGGEISGSLRPSADGPRAVAVVTSGGEAEIRSQGSKPAEFLVTVNPDNTSTLALFSGSAEVTAEGGTAVLEPNQSVVIEPAKPPGAPVTLPDAPSSSFPPDGHRQRFGAAAPGVEFRWEPARGASTYRIVIARDAAFEDVVLDERVERPRFFHGNLGPGEYFWRVRGLAGRAQGAPGPTRRLHLVQDIEPPPLEVEIPDEVGTDRLVVRGRTEPGSKVLVGGEEVSVLPDGSFERVVVLRPGVNMIVIEAADEAGNGVYQAKYVTARL